MTLSHMPMIGKWEKIREEWNEISELKIEPQLKNLTDRKIIDEICRKRYNFSKRKVFDVPRQKYHSQTRLREEIDLLCEEFSEIISQYSIGKTVQGRDIVCLKITEGVKQEARSLLKPQVKFVGGIHGDEVVGRELLLYLARALAHQYGLDSSVTSLLHNTEIHIVPSLNVDGYILKTRNNANDKDLNRGFSDWADLGRTDHSTRLEGREVEVVAVMEWLRKNNFVLSASYHDGWSMVIFPWDDSPACTETQNAVCSEDSTFYALAKAYTCHHTFMDTGHCPCHPEPLPLGNYRSEELEVVEGGMQDYNYMFAGCLELTVELSCDKRPHSKTLLKHWTDNYHSMLALLSAADSGVKGITMDEEGNAIGGVVISVRGIERDVISNERGEYWIILLPGQYSLSASHSNSLGTVTGDFTVQVKRYLGEGAELKHLVLKPR